MSELVRKHLHLVTADFQSWLALLDDEIVIVFPYGESAGGVSELRGKAAITETISGFLAQVPGFRFIDPLIYETTDPNVAFATYQALEVLVGGTDRIYRQSYISQFRARDGKLTRITEYYDPVKTMAALGA